MRNKVYWLPVFLILSILSGCLFPYPIPTKYRYSSSIDKPEEVTQNTYPPTNPQNVVITFGDITDRKYVVIGDITVIIDPYGAPGGKPF